MTNERALKMPLFDLNSIYSKTLVSLFALTVLTFLTTLNVNALDYADYAQQGRQQPTTQEEEIEITKLLIQARADLEAGRLTEPVDNNAYNKVIAILKMDPNNLDAARVLYEIIKTHMQSLQTALNKGETEDAKHYLKQIRYINPDAIAVTEAEKALDNNPKETKKTLAKKEPHALAGDMIQIPGGTFIMGTLEGRKDEKPLHLVTVPDFEIAKYEVTVGQFRKFVEATGYSIEKEDNGNVGCFADGGGVDFGYKPEVHWYAPGFQQTDNHPVVCVSWNDAQAFIAWLNKETGSNYSLATEAKWEYATRANTTTDYHFGNNKKDICAYGNAYDEVASNVNKYGWGNSPCNDGEAKTAEVGQYKANPYGLYDMNGNVWEWVDDCWKSGYHDAPSNGDAYKNEECSYRVTRGGSWYNVPLGVRSANRYWYGPSYRSFNVGFRLYRDL